MNILVRMPNWIGDLVMATPVLADLRRKFPDSSITAMCKRPICDLLKEDPSIDELFCFTKVKNSFLRREQRDIVAHLKEGKFDVAVLLTNSFSSAWWVWQGDVKRRIGFGGNLRSLLLTDVVKRAKEKEHLVETYKRLLTPLEISPSTTMPKLFVTEKERAACSELLGRFGYRGKKLIAINPGASYGSAKCWPAKNFRKLAEMLLQKIDAHIAFLGDASMRPLVKEICQGLDERAMNLAGVTNLRELMCVIERANILITNDSGPAHIGAALDVPLVTLFGSTDEEITGPYGKKESVIHKKVACSPCFKRECPIDLRCMEQISVEEVLEKALQLCSGR